ncbi:hypothetical protein [Brachybacterium sp. AOP29-B2-41]|uniref:hypothetical protein n=1 Tax=Brachybacterium sp. AOP29-B2-41 TaxID=3457704 RepID=UPI00403353AD
MREVLGIEVGDDLLSRWWSWWAPALQPFRMDGLPGPLAAQIPLRSEEATAEVRDTYFLYDGTWTWLTQDEVEALPSAARRALLSRRRTCMRPKPSPPWPSRQSRDGEGALLHWVEAGVAPSEHAQVSAATWWRARPVLPGADALAGTFPQAGSGANCFATVVAAAEGIAVADEWMQIAPFEDWLVRRTIPWSGTAHDDDPGTVLVWTEHGTLVHAAISLGDGWVLHKPSQSWSSPRLVWSVRRLVHTWTFPGTRLSRHLLRP